MINKPDIHMYYQDRMHKSQALAKWNKLIKIVFEMFESNPKGDLNDIFFRENWSFVRNKLNS